MTEIKVNFPFFPILSSEGKRPWSAICRMLSSRLRSQRHANKRKYDDNRDVCADDTKEGNDQVDLTKKKKDETTVLQKGSLYSPS